MVGEVVVAKSDVTGTERIGIDDITAVALAFNKAEGESGYDSRLDMNKDGIIDIFDISYVLMQMLKNVAK